MLSKPDEGAGSRWFQRLLLSHRLGRDKPPLLSKRGKNTEKYNVNFAFDKKRVCVKTTRGSLQELNWEILINNITLRITNADEFYCLVLK